MANFARIGNALEGILANQLTAARNTQGGWEWYNALQRIISANRFTGTAYVVGPAAALDSGTAVDIEGASALLLFGAIVDNSNAAEAVWLTGYDLATGSVTVGTSLFKAALFVPSATTSYVVWPDGLTFATALSVHSGTGTAAGLEAGTGVTGTNPTYTLVYTKG